MAAFPESNSSIDEENSQATPIPLIPLPPLLSSVPTSLTKSTSLDLLHAFQRHGFLYLTELTEFILPSDLSYLFSLSAAFFAQPQSAKDALAWTTPRANRGYVRLGREKVSQYATKEEVAAAREGKGDDMKESFEIGRDGEEGCPNRWPSETCKDEDINGLNGNAAHGIWDKASEFRTAMQSFFLACQKLHKMIMRAIALGMKLEETYFDDFVQQGDNTLRLLHYPAVSKGGFDGGKRERAGAHTDYGSVTFLFQDERGGLQVEPPDGEIKEWKDVEPRKGTIVVNAGDLLARWSNDMIRSTRHRVVEPPLRTRQEHEQGYPPRYSIAYFCNPDFDKWIEALPGTWEGTKKGKKYRGIYSGEYMVSRLSATY